jgi:hypothetical protein
MAGYLLPTRRSSLIDPEAPKVHSNAGSVSSSHDFGYAQPRTHWNLDAEEIINKLAANRTFKVGGLFDVDGLPTFDDLTRYGVSEEKGKELASLEIERLTKVVNSAKPIQLEGDPCWFGRADEEGYLRLDKLAQQIKIAIDICSHDTALLMLDYDPSNAALERFSDSRAGILRVFDGRTSVDPVDTWSRMKIENANDRAMHCVVNYLTGTLALVLMRSMKGDFWDDNCIITLARTSAKVKVVASNLAHAAEISLAGKKEWATHIGRFTKDEPNPPTVDNEKRISEIQKQNLALARQVVVKNERYFSVMSTFSENIHALLSKVAIAMGSAPGAALPPNLFESCSLVYDSGFRDGRALLCQERNGAIGASGSRGEVHCASFTFGMCLEVFESLASRIECKTPGSSDPATMIYWKWTKMGVESEVYENTEPMIGQRWLTSMADIITAFIPYLMVCGPFSNVLDTMTQRVASISDPGDPVSMCTETRFLASFMVRASEYELFSAKVFGRDNDVTSVSDSSVALTRALDQGPDTTLPQNTDRKRETDLQNQLAKENQPIAAGLDMMEAWTTDIESITISSRWYCWGTLTFCGALVIGGLLIGFTVKDRIEGVDPSNLSVFCWTVAAFIVLVMKSLRVENWTWRDFFRGKVVCRSVSEVTAVTGIDDQVLLSILRYSELRNIMRKKGPFRGIFARLVGDGESMGGFVIDLPLTTTSLMRSGCFFIQVQGSQGPALVVIDGSEGIPYNAVEPQSFLDNGQRVNCQNVQDPGRWGSGDRAKDLHVLITNKLKWSRVVGIFRKEAYFT